MKRRPNHRLTRCTNITRHHCFVTLSLTCVWCSERPNLVHSSPLQTTNSPREPQREPQAKTQLPTASSISTTREWRGLSNQ
ncbi:hypothetical protein E2C01_028459 [Portunus trituberculatus]|uniref:Uncharacterized protein n=1 Tax=Portunus trituberculatus TaxID=210409 RepID=A0A5B7EPI8_PORTR|nr:hypothetical protein [Portunus trituberculatus]